MKTPMYACMALCLAACAWAQPSPDASSAAESTGRGSEHGGIPVTQLIAAVSRSTGKKFVLDPRVWADVNLVGISPSSVTYAQLLMILRLHGYAAVEGSGVVQVVPDAAVRSMPVPLLDDRETKPDSEIVTDTFHVKNSPAALYVPILRPLLPQWAHLAADTCGSNSLIIVDTYANVKRIEAIVQRLDVGEPYQSRPCDTHPPREAAPQPREAPAVK
jgi:type II secretory pathway component GspD/PulD (secretin)